MGARCRTGSHRSVKSCLGVSNTQFWSNCWRTRAAKERRLVAMSPPRQLPTATSNQFLRDLMSVVLEDESMLS